jgi:hypothetical protein
MERFELSLRIPLAHSSEGFRDTGMMYRGRKLRRSDNSRISKQSTSKIFMEFKAKGVY